MKPFEQTIRIATTFFSLMVGMGLSRLLAPESFHQTFPDDRWYCFTAALLLFLRFLFGSANHLWKEFGGEDVVGSKTTRISIILHLLCLIIFGFIAIRICYSYDSLDFLVWNVRFGLAGAIFTLIEMAWTKVRMKGNRSGQNWSKGWFCINATHAAVAGVILGWLNCEKAHGGISSSFNLPLGCFVAVCGILLVWDLAFQLEKVGNTAP